MGKLKILDNIYLILIKTCKIKLYIFEYDGIYMDYTGIENSNLVWNLAKQLLSLVKHK